MSDQSDEPEVGPGAPAGAPVMPWSINLNSCVRHFSRGPGGGVRLHFTVAEPVGGGGQFALASPQVVITFSAEQWEVFQREVANNGAKPRIETAQVVPPPLPRIH